MKLEDQVCSLELVKRLKELGVKQGKGMAYWLPDGTLIWPLGSADYHAVEDCIRAFTVAELGEMLPKHFTTKGRFCIDDKPWECGCFLRELKEQKYFTDDIEANARAKMLIYLIEKGIVKL